MATHTITALFDNQAEAQQAADRLALIRIDRSVISIIRQDRAATGAAAAARREEGGFWSTLARLPLPDEDRYTYTEGIRRGGVLLTAAVAEARADEVIRILEDGGAVDLDERESEWWASGWRGYEPATGARDAARDRLARARSETPGTGATERKEAVPIGMAELRASGRRELGRGGGRVRSYVAP